MSFGAAAAAAAANVHPMAGCGMGPMMMPGMPMTMAMMSPSRGRGKAMQPMMPGMMPMPMGMVPSAHGSGPAAGMMPGPMSAMAMPGMMPMTMGMVPPARGSGPAAATSAFAVPWMTQQQAAAPSVHQLMFKMGSSNRSSSARPKAMLMTSDRFPVKVHCLEHIKEFCFSEAVDCMMRNWSAAWNPATLPGLQPQDITYCWLVGWDLSPAEPVQSGLTKSQWQMSMSYMYQSKGHKLQSMTMEQVREKGKAMLADHEAEVAKHQQAFEAQYLAMQAQNMAMFQPPGMQAFHWPGSSSGSAGHPGEGVAKPGNVPAPVHAPVPGSEVASNQAQLITAPDGRKFLQVQERSRFLSREHSGGADDWTLSPARSTLLSPSKSWAASVTDVVHDESGQGESWHPASEELPGLTEAQARCQEQWENECCGMQQRVQELIDQEAALRERIAAKRRRLQRLEDSEQQAGLALEKDHGRVRVQTGDPDCGDDLGHVAERVDFDSADDSDHEADGKTVIMQAGETPGQQRAEALPRDMPGAPAGGAAVDKPEEPASAGGPAAAQPEMPVPAAEESRANAQSDEDPLACNGEEAAVQPPVSQAHGKAPGCKAPAPKAPATKAKAHAKAPAKAAAAPKGRQTTLLPRTGP